MSGALVPLTAAVSARAPYAPVARANAAFIAHLVATRVQAPQTRMRRRAEPAEAAAVYGGVGQWPNPSGQLLAQSF